MRRGCSHKTICIPFFMITIMMMIMTMIHWIQVTSVKKEVTVLDSLEAKTTTLSHGIHSFSLSLSLFLFINIYKCFHSFYSYMTSLSMISFLWKSKWWSSSKGDFTLHHYRQSVSVFICLFIAFSCDDLDERIGGRERDIITIFVSIHFLIITIIIIAVIIFSSHAECLFYVERERER